jgi:predicted dehydrogenase
MNTAVLIGAGDRGQAYAGYAKKHGLVLKAVADPDPHRRRRIAQIHSIGEDLQFETADDLLSRPAMAAGAIIATMDSLHFEPARRALAAGYHVLLEKPMAQTLAQSEQLALAAAESGRYLLICHVLRSTRFFKRIKDILDSGLIGRTVSIYHSENVTPFHMAHSYVRGNWRREDESSPLILAKCSHDLDLIHWYAGSRAVRVSSSGGIAHFKPENKPFGAADRCNECRITCTHNAESVYVEGLPARQSLALSRSAVGMLSRLTLAFPFLTRLIPKARPWSYWPTSTIVSKPGSEEILRALREGPFGECVYNGQNNQVDHQEAWIEFENGVHAVFRFHGFSAQEGRSIRIDGTLGSLRASTSGGGSLEVLLHSGRRVRFPERFNLAGHAEGDEGIVRDFISLSGGQGRSDAESSLESHRIAFAAHESRTTGRTIILRQPLTPGTKAH